MSNAVTQAVTISKVAMIAIDAAVAGYSFYKENKDKYQDFFQSVLKYMDAMEIDSSKLTGAQKKAYVLDKAREVAFDLFKNWEHIADVVAKLIDEAKSVYNVIMGKVEEIKDTLKSLGK